jgi:hypothetical protein
MSELDRDHLLAAANTNRGRLQRRLLEMVRARASARCPADLGALPILRTGAVWHRAQAATRQGAGRSGAAARTRTWPRRSSCCANRGLIPWE